MNKITFLVGLMLLGASLNAQVNPQKQLRLMPADAPKAEKNNEEKSVNQQQNNVSVKNIGMRQLRVLRSEGNEQNASPAARVQSRNISQGRMLKMAAMDAESPAPANQNIRKSNVNVSAMKMGALRPLSRQ